MRHTNTLQLAAILRQNGIDPVILFGAGASATSGVPMAHDMAMQAARWATAIDKGRRTDDPRIMASDVQIYLQSQPWYSHNIGVDDLFQHSMRLLNSPRELRREFLFNVLNNVLQPSIGYRHLAQLAKARIIRTMLTTNFDDRFQSAFGAGPLIVTSQPGEHQRINTAPVHPQLIYLHSKADHYMDRIMEEEVQELDPHLTAQVKPLLRDHPLIIVGYRGAEPSIMQSLLLDQLSYAGNFPHGIFWCVLEGTNFEDLSPMVQELARQIGDNFAILPIQGFDQFITDLSASIMPDSLNTKQETSSIVFDDPATFPFDMRPAAHARIDEINQTLLRRIVIEHSYRTATDIPNQPNQDWYNRRLIDIGLFTRDQAGSITPTNAALLLCADNARHIASGHWLEVSTPTRPPVAIDGPLTEIYETVFERLQEANRPIRVKGNQSRNVEPYGPIALKEMLANALVHRNYESREPVRIWIDKDFIKIESPGGLDDSLKQRLADSAQSHDPSSISDEFKHRISQGQIGPSFTSYRNPILAEAFWGLGFVDKAGSGLVDAIKSLTENGASADLEIPDSNDRFIATASLSHLDINESTHTALPLRPIFYSASVTEFLTIPTTIYSAPAKINHPREIAALAGNRPLPPFALRQGRLFTFANLNDPSSGFSLVAHVNQAEQHSFEKISNDPHNRNIAPELLKKALELRFRHCGIRVDRSKNRAYYPCNHRDFRSIKYTTMSGRPETRRVAWWPKRLNDGHCIHQAVNYRIAQFGDAWGLTLQPTYVVTMDGTSEQLPAPEHASIVTTILSDHYNPKVLADVRFWLKQLETQDSIIAIDVGDTLIQISTKLITFEGYSDRLEEHPDDNLIES